MLSYLKKGFGKILFVIVIISVMIFGLIEKGRFDTDNNLRENSEERTKHVSQYKGAAAYSSKSSAKKEKNIAVEVQAANAILVDMEQGSVLYKKNIDKKIKPASTAKLVTALTVLEYCGSQDIVQVGNEILKLPDDASRAYLRVGQNLTIKMLLEGMLLPSGGDAALTLAVFTGNKIGGGNLSDDRAIELFVEAMNETADRLHAANSHFVNPDGYDEDGQYTTAEDLAKIAGVCLQNDIIKDIVSQGSIREITLDGTDVTWENTNLLLNSESSYYYPKAIGLKTGSTPEAGKCLVSAANISGKIYICVVMGSIEDGRFSDSINLYNYIDKGEK